MKSIKVINRFIVENDHLMYDTLNAVDNKSIWRKLFKFTIRYAGSMRRIKSKAIINGKMENIDALIITYFVKGKVQSYIIRYENGIIRESDEGLNEDFEFKINHLENFICKYNIYTKISYSAYVKKLIKDLRK